MPERLPNGRFPKGSGIPAGGYIHTPAGGPGNGRLRPAFEPGNPGILHPEQVDRQVAGRSAREIIVAAAEEAARRKVAELDHEHPLIASRAATEILDRALGKAAQPLTIKGDLDSLTDEQLERIAAGGSLETVATEVDPA